MIGFTPAQVDAMSAWEFACCMAGYARVHGGKSDGSGSEMSDERARELGLVGF